MTLPAPFTVTLLTAGTPTEDADGNTVEGFPSETQLAAISIAPHVDEKRSGETYLDTWDLDVFLPKTAVSTQDRMIIDGVTYEVVNVADWTLGFHRWQPGISVGLKKWTG